MPQLLLLGVFACSINSVQWVSVVLSVDGRRPTGTKGFAGSEGIMPATINVEESRPLSLYDEAQQEAERHKWIESQKSGQDLGTAAISEWYRIHWVGYCRNRQLDHLRGRRLFREFGIDRFAQLESVVVQRDLLIDRILDRVAAGYENLGLINWAMDWGLPIDRVYRILVQLDVNRARLEPAER